MSRDLLVLVLHGGGWVSGSPTSMSAATAALNQRGAPALAVPYPLGDFPAAAANVRDQIAAARLAGFSRVVVYGFSAGGTLAAYAAARGWPDAAIVESAPVDLVTFRTVLRMPYFGQRQHYIDAGLGTMALRRRWSPTRRWDHVTPTLALYGTDDAFVPLSQGRALDRRPGVKLIVKPGGKHEIDPRCFNHVAHWAKKSEL